jgi:multidrug transporter EmrE-like cation transporter
MIYIGFSILCSVLIGNLLMLYHRDKQFDILIVFLGNYFVAALFSFLQNRSFALHITTIELAFGIITGILFLLNFLVYQSSIGINGLSFSIGTMRSSIVIPALMAFILFGDLFNPLIVVGLVLIISVFIYLSEKGTMKSLHWLMLLFFVTGITESTLKIYHEYGSSNQSPFLVTLFTSAFILTAIIIIMKKRPMHVRSLINGFVLGVPNQLSTLFFLWGLKSVPATIAYPVAASGIVTLGIISDVLIWKKRFTSKQKIAVVLLMISVILLSFTEK